MRKHGIDTIRAFLHVTNLPPIKWGKTRLDTGPTAGGDQEHFEGISSLGGVRVVGHRATSINTRQTAVLSTRLSVETCLPKLIWGNNVEAIRDTDDLARAIAKANEVVSSVIGRDADLVGWQMSRIDVTADRQFGSDSQLRIVLNRLANESIGRTYPVRAPGSVTWRRKWGAVTYLVYSKLAESGDPRAQGILRVEAQAKGHGVIRESYPPAIRPRIVTVGSLLDDNATTMQERITAPITRLINYCVANAPTGVPAIVDQLLDQGVHLGTIARLVGGALLQRKFGWDAMAAWTTRQTISNWRREFRELGIRPEEMDL